MAFDWLEFLRAKRIHYATKGRNVAAGAVAIKCPFCGAADPSEHLVIRLNGRGWWCWRNRAHRGHSAAWLVSRLLHVSVEAAAAITKETQFLPSGDFLTNMRRTLFGEITLEGEADAGPDPLDKPREWRSIVDGTAGRAYRNYLRGRGFTDLMIADRKSVV